MPTAINFDPELCFKFIHHFSIITYTFSWKLSMIIHQGWFATLLCVKRTHLTRPNLGANAQVKLKQHLVIKSKSIGNLLGKHGCNKTFTASFERSTTVLQFVQVHQPSHWKLLKLTHQNQIKIKTITMLLLYKPWVVLIFLCIHGDVC